MEFDLNLIKYFFEKYKKKLTYFGLSGKDFSDIIDWNDYIDSFLTIEYKKELIPELVKNLQENYLESKGKYIEGDIIDLICKKDYRIEYPYDLINFDFLGTFIYEKEQDLEVGLKRIEVFRNILIEQGKKLKNGNCFIYLITLSGQRGKDITVFNNALESLKRKENKKIINWLLNDDNNVRQYQKISYVLPCLVLKSCLNLFDIKKFIHIVYKAKKTLMVHFCFLLEKNVKAFLDFSVIDLDKIHNTDVILINKKGLKEKMKGIDFFTSEDPFRNSFLSP